MERTCPLCGKPMTLRRGRYGPFLGCTAYPGCRGTRQVDDEVDGRVVEKSMLEQQREWDRRNELNLDD